MTTRSRKKPRPRDNAQTRFSTCSKPLVDEALQHAAHLDAGADTLHKLRVALRRLRTLLWAWRPLLDREAVKIERAYLKRAGMAAGSARDWDIAMTLVHEYADAAAIVGERMQAARTEARERARATLAATGLKSALREMLHAMNRELNTAHRRVPVKRFARERLRAAQRALKKRERRAKRAKRSDYAAWHDVRKAAKKLRYVLEFFSADLPRREVKRLKPLKRLQNRFGALNDAVSVAQLFDAHREVFADTASADATLAALARTRKRRMRRAAKLIGA
ncbi:Adenylate cyclase [Paraburkholderia tropica]|uniref:CHAD domain-containing protein n=1 Tax=Paraburkholderia tropica TaxID=92647 RepID=UPI001CB23A8D|nr:CHAD domain-containing protein [Paraburkholderia tropica]CAG9226045.1 Adenylate cyclase [Paraburkholderia tropica]